MIIGGTDRPAETEEVSCPDCGRELREVPRSGRPVFHLVLLVLTAGLWLPVWVLAAVFLPGRKCAECGAAIEREEDDRPFSRRLSRRLGDHFARYGRFGPWAFIWRIALESIGVGIVAGTVATLFFPYGRDDLDMSAAGLFVLGVLVAPVLETLLFQFLFIEVGRRLGAGFRLQVAVSTVPFAAAHFLSGPVPGIAAGLVGGFYLAFTYASWRPRSMWTALWTTTVSHALHNFPLVLVTLLAGG